MHIKTAISGIVTKAAAARKLRPMTHPPPPPPPSRAKFRSAPEFLINSGTLAKLIVLALILTLSAIPALAADIVVADGGTCSLYNAWLSARYNEDRGGCTHTGDWDDNNWSDVGDPGGDTIILQKDVTGGDLQMFGSRVGAERSRGNITIEGGGHTYTMTANNGRHFHIGGRRLTINNLVLTRADNTNKAGPGGAILVAGASNTDAELTVNDSVFHGNKSHDEGGAIMINDRTSATIRRSVFYNNEAGNRGSAIGFGRGTKVTVDSSSFYNNNGQGVIAAKRNQAAGEIILKHVTIVNNRGSRGGVSFSINESVQTKFELSNSIDYNNTGGACQLNGPLPTDTTLRNNIVGAGSTQNCKDGANTVVVDPLLPDSAGVTTLLHLVPLPGSPAIDAVSAADCEAVVGTGISRDPAGTARPQNGACEIGAYEVEAPRPPDTRSGGDGDGGDEYQPAPAPVSTPTPRPPTCLSLPSHISVYNITHSTQCTRVDAAGIGNAAVLGLGFRDGVDIWGWVLHDTQVCFDGSSGSFRFLDAATSPRAVSELPAVGKDGRQVCATIDRAGTVAWVNGPPVPAATAIPPAYQSLSGCMVLLQYILNFRDAPDGDKIGVLPSQIKLTALERTAGWFHVDYHGARGWISAMYVKPEGNCG